MPEGHTLHRIARQHQASFAGQPLQVSSPQGRFRKEAGLLQGEQVDRVEAYGKHLFYHWSHGEILHIHLGLYGKFQRFDLPAPDPVGQVRLRVVGAAEGFDLTGPTACELITPDKYATIESRLGQDPLRQDRDPESAWEAVHASRSPIGTLLLKQEIFAGVGNVFRAELLFVAGLHPETPGKLLTRAEFDALWRQLVEWMEIGVEHGRIITTDPRTVGVDRSEMNDAQRLFIYKRDECPRCGREVAHWKLGGREIYACLNCQPQRQPQRQSSR